WACSTGCGCGLRCVAVGCGGLGFTFTFFSGIGTASGSSVFSCGLDCDNPFDSVASTLLVSAGFAGRGILATSVTPIALPPPPAPQFVPWPLPAIHAYIATNNVKPACNAADHARFLPQRSCSKNISPLSMGFKRLRNNAHVGDARLLYRVHHRCKCSERDIFVGAQKNGLVRRIADLFAQCRTNLIDVDGIVTEENAL